MIGRKPEGYKDLLAYQKAAQVQELTLHLTNLFPKSFAWLKEQMDKSGRSGTKNIIEGWKRNETREYFTFLGFAIAALEELKDDCADIAKGLYQGLMTIRGLWEARGLTGERGGRGNGTGERGEMGGKGGMGAGNPLTHLQPVTPFQPFPPIELEKLRFYPLDPSLPPIVQLYLKCKEVLMLLHKLQQSLDVKMDRELTKSPNERARKRILQYEEDNRGIEKEIQKMGFVRLIDGQVIKREEWEERVKEGEDLKLFGE